MHRHVSLISNLYRLQSNTFLNSMRTPRSIHHCEHEDLRFLPKQRLQLAPICGGAELGAWSLKEDAAYFLAVFRRELLVEVA